MLDGIINRDMAGKTIQSVRKDGTWLIIRTKCDHEFKIGWTQDDNGTPIKGEPFLKQVDVRINLSLPAGKGAVWGTG